MRLTQKTVRGLSLPVVALVVLAACEQSLGLRLLAPEDNAVISCSSVDAGVVRFSWTPVAAARSYTIVVYDASGQQFLTRTTTDTTIELQLPCGASYSWQVAANPGGSSYWTPRRRFTLTGETFSLITPRDGDTVSCTTPPRVNVRFSWTVVRDATEYNLVVWNGRGEVAATARVTGTSTEIQVFCGDTYRWQVTAVKNFPNPPVQSPVWTFSVSGAPGGGGPQLISPPDGATVQCSTPTNGSVLLDWTDVQNASSYTLEVYRVSDGSLVVSRNVTASQSTETIPCQPNGAITYRWRVGANVNGNTVFSGFFTFTMVSGVNAPQLISPPDGATIECQAPDNGRVNFDWTDVQNATSYTLEVYRASDGSLFLSRTVTASQTTETVVCRPELALQYRWRVGAHVNSNVFWSGFSTFTMTVEKPFLVSPPNGSTVALGAAACAANGTRSVLFTWTVVLNATSYRVDVYDKPTGNLVGSTVVAGATNTSALVTWTDPNPCPRTYQWRVTAVKTAPNPPVASDTWEFTAVP
ncbi:MAG: hypothetical protein QN193_04570 [Armatimonadota bacterium]|nr:hypothetical protein [Armatimonadota bacterium]MDR7445075.1 hypothetical protein [Armatimonadota bacterium]MDR7569860.1 hypothetical protein [Armatimonadota bacterium]MDR7614161.1 hypothetical protein [Armatimonadota bacterium]